MSDEPRTVRLVFDATAVAAFMRGSIAVGEILAEIDEEHGCVILPLACLVEAAASLLDREHLDLLIGHPATVLVSDDPAEWLALTQLRILTGRPDCAAAALIALDYQVDVMTREPGWYSAVAGGRRVLRFDD